MNLKRGEIYLDTDFGTGEGSEQSGKRPCVIISNDMCNRYSPTVTVVPITTQNKTSLPTHHKLSKRDYRLPDDSTVLVEQMRTIDKSRLGVRHFKSVTREDMKVLDDMIKIQLGVL